MAAVRIIVTLGESEHDNDELLRDITNAGYKAIRAVVLALKGSYSRRDIAVKTSRSGRTADHNQVTFTVSGKSGDLIEQSADSSRAQGERIFNLIGKTIQPAIPDCTQFQLQVGN